MLELRAPEAQRHGGGGHVADGAQSSRQGRVQRLDQVGGGVGRGGQDHGVGDQGPAVRQA